MILKQPKKLNPNLNAIMRIRAVVENKKDVPFPTQRKLAKPSVSLAPVHRKPCAIIAIPTISALVSRVLDIVLLEIDARTGILWNMDTKNIHINQSRSSAQRRSELRQTDQQTGPQQQTHIQAKNKSKIQMMKINQRK